MSTALNLWYCTRGKRSILLRCVVRGMVCLVCVFFISIFIYIICSMVVRVLCGVVGIAFCLL